MRVLVLLAVALAACAPRAPAPARPAPPPSPYEAWEVKIPMRDGARLRTVIFAPKQRAGLPFVLMRDPYWLPPPDPAVIAEDLGREAPYALRDGYIVVLQLVRGHGGSEGEFVMMRPATPGGVDESTDTHDTIEWLLAHVGGNNGRVGLFGISYSAFTAVAALTAPHPAIKVVSEGGSPADMFANDDFHHNGAFRLYYAFQYVYLLERDVTKLSAYDFKKQDAYDFFLEHGSAADLDAAFFQGKAPTWRDFMEHPNRDEFWRRRAVPEYLRKTTVPVLHTAGWYDQEDFAGPLAIYRTLEAHDGAGLNHLIVGPWNHGGWIMPEAKLGPLDFGADPSATFADLNARWMRRWLKGAEEPDLPEAMVFETGSNVWRRLDAWPPRQARPRRIYFGAGGTLAPAPAAAGADEYVSDPAAPVPFRPRPVAPLIPIVPNWTEWMLADQRFLAGRTDVLTYTGEPLAADLAIAGDVVAELHAATDREDADWVVKLIDVAPDGYQLIVSADVLRGRFRDGLDAPRPVRPGDVVRYTVPLGARAHVFLPGHRVAVQVQSSWFPLIDRNPQKWVDNIYRATAADYVAARHRILRGGAQASAIVLPVVER